MKRHRKEANAVRIFLGRGKFARGPRFISSMTLPYKFPENDSLEDHETDDEAGPNSAPINCYNVATGSCDVNDPALVHDNTGDEEFGNEEENSRVLETNYDSNVRDEAAWNQVELNVEGLVSSSRNSDPIQETVRNDSMSSHGSVEVNPEARLDDDADSGPAIFEQQRAPETNVEELSELEEHNAGVTEDVSRIPGFFAWLRRSKAWIDFFHQHSPSYAAMDHILRIISAPCKSWKTVMENIIRASELKESLETYSICPEHVCFASLKGDEEVHHCSVCGKSRPESSDQANTVTYIPILPRIKRIFQNEQKCGQFYSYKDEGAREEGIMSDFFDSAVYEEIVSAHGGEDSCQYDVFLALSTDGFQVYKNRRCDVWPVVGVLLNLPPSQRYAAKNVLPLMFVPGPSEPKDLQSFFVPIVNEIISINEEGGTTVSFYDGVVRKIRVHLVWFTADLAALRKCASLTGVRGKTPCRFCLIQGYYIAASRGYYFPSWLMKNDDPRKRLSLFSIRRLPDRSASSIADAINRLEDARTRAERDIISRETGIQGQSILCKLSSVKLFTSFPVDIMHLFYNVQRLLLRSLLGSVEDLSLPGDVCGVLDHELVAFGTGISGQICSSPRELSEWHNWKAVEHKQFTLSYCLILFDGYLRPDLMKGLGYFADLVDICFRCTITKDDIDRAGSLAISFVEHYEAKYMLHKESRAHFCTYVIHLLLHLTEEMERNGPLIGCSQYWVEKYIGWVSQRLNARHLAAESFRKSAIFSESCKAYFQEPFHEDDREKLYQENLDAGGFVCLGAPRRRTVDQRLRRLMENYLIRKYDEMDVEKAKSLSSEVLFLREWKKLRFISGGATEVASVFDSRGHKRPSHFVAVEMDSTESEADVYYGRMLHILEFTLEPGSSDECNPPWATTHKVIVLDWATRLIKGQQGQVFKRCRRKDAFSSPTMEDVHILRRLIGAVEHAVPPNAATGSAARSSQTTQRTRGIRTYFVDPMCRTHNLLQPNIPSSDGIIRSLKGF